MIWLNLFLTFAQIGLFTFGGGYAMVPLIRDAALAAGWLSERELVDLIAVSESTPGPLAVNAATFVGARVGGLPGAVCATLGVVLPSFLVILLAAKFIARFRESRALKGCMTGVRPAVVGLIGAALLSVAAAVFFPDGLSLATCRTPAFLLSAGIFVLSAAAAFKKAHPLLVIGISAALGVAGGYALGL